MNRQIISDTIENMFFAKPFTDLPKNENEHLVTDSQHFTTPLLRDETNFAIRAVEPNAIKEKHRPVKVK